MHNLDLYEQYIAEKAGIKMLSRKNGFLTYSVLPEGVFLEDLFIRATARRNGVYTSLINELSQIARELGKQEIIGRIVFGPNNMTANETLKAALNSGWTVTGLNPTEIWITLSIKKE